MPVHLLKQYWDEKKFGVFKNLHLLKVGQSINFSADHLANSRMFKIRRDLTLNI